MYTAFEGQRLQISIGDWAKDMEKSNLWPVKHIAIFYFARFDNGTLHLNNNHKSYFLQYSSFFTLEKGAKTCKRRAKGKPCWRHIALGIVSKTQKCCKYLQKILRSFIGVVAYVRFKGHVYTQKRFSLFVLSTIVNTPWNFHFGPVEAHYHKKSTEK